MTVTAFASGTKTPPAAFTVSATNASATLTSSVAHGLAVGDRVKFYEMLSSGVVWTNFVSGVEYWVVSVPSGTTFTVSATEGGGAITSGTTRSAIRCDAEYVLGKVNAAGVYELEVDLQALADGDHYEFFVYNKVLTGGVRRVAWCGAYGGVQPRLDYIKNSPPVSNELTDSDSLEFTMRPLRSAARAAPWKILAH